LQGASVTAGESADAEARRQLALAAQHERAAREARETAARYSIAAVTEKATMRALTPLAAAGMSFLQDRRWPGSRHAQVDLVAIGPQGVFILDTKAWKDVSIQEDRVFRGDEDVTDEFQSLESLADVTEADLAEVGLAPGEVRVIVVLAGRQGIHARVGRIDIVGERDVLRHVAAVGVRLSATQVDTVLGRALSLFPQVNAPAPVTPAVPPVVVPLATDEPEPLLSDDEVRDALMAGILAEPIESWMSFLHPEQAKLIRRSFNGPSRIRGAAGTGKTVVGLHRAAYLARQGRRVLVTTYVRTLPVVLGSLLGRLAPDAVERVTFTGVHAFALGVLRDRGIQVGIKPKAADAAFTEAWAGVPTDSPLHSKDVTSRYWREEIDYVIKGRGIDSFEAYAELSRTGRGHTLGQAQRRAVWELYTEYDRLLREAGAADFADVILMAERELQREPLAEPYDAVIVDEAQDLSCAMVRMLYRLVGDRPDGFTLVGDGQQSIYPGGYTLAEAGISVANRGVVLSTNYRNTAEILDWAHSMIAGSEYADIEGEIARGERPADVPRHGPRPVVTRHTSRSRLETELERHLRSVTTEVGTALGDCAVLVRTTYDAGRVRDRLQAAGLACVDLEEYDGSSADAVKVGTIKRAKGLEFKHVMISHLPARTLPSQTPPGTGAAREEWELWRRELFVGATRARDGLWFGILD
jgi:hypothetical protein